VLKLRGAIDCSIILRAHLVDSDWAAHAGSAQTAVPVRYFVQILPELALGAPEAAEAEDRGTQILGERWLEGRAKDGVPLRKFERRLLPARKRLGGGDSL
jgi:hypothetical protein